MRKDSRGFSLLFSLFCLMAPVIPLQAASPDQTPQDIQVSQASPNLQSVQSVKFIVLKNTANSRSAELALLPLDSGDYIPVAGLARVCRFMYEFDRITRKALLQNDDKLGQIMPGNEYLSFGLAIARCGKAPVMSGGEVCVAVEDAPSLLKGLGLDNWEFSIREKETEQKQETPIEPIVRGAPQNIGDQPDSRDGSAAVLQDNPVFPASDLEAPDLKDNLQIPADGGDNNQLKFIIIDPGHGGPDPGGIGLTGLREKGVVLKVSLMVKALLEEQLPGVQIILTRDRNDFVSLDDRSRIANDILKVRKNGLFLSIHANISRNKQTYGFENYFLSDNPSDDEARAVAASENGVIDSENSQTGIVNRVLSSMLDAELIRQSKLFAEALNGGFGANLGTFTGSRGIKTARFRVLEGTMMPSVLTEIGFLSNSREEKLLRDDEYLARVALAVVEGIVGFARQYNKHNGFTMLMGDRPTSNV